MHQSKRSTPCNQYFVPDEPIARQPIPTSGTYIVKSGDNPWTISRKFRVKNNDLLAANGLNRSSVLKIGQTLVIPQSSGSAPVMTSVVTPDATVKTATPGATIEDANKTTNDILNSVDDPIAPNKVTQPLTKKTI